MAFRYSGDPRQKIAVRWPNPTWRRMAWWFVAITATRRVLVWWNGGSLSRRKFYQPITPLLRWYIHL